MVGNFFYIRQPGGRTVNGNQAMSEPGFGVEMFIEETAQMTVEFDEGFKLELHPCSWQGDFGDDAFGHIRSIQSLEKFIQFILVRTFDEVEKEKNKKVEGEFAVAGEVLFWFSVSVEKILRVDNISQIFN